MNDNLKTNIEEQLHAEMQRLKKAREDRQLHLRYLLGCQQKGPQPSPP